MYNALERAWRDRSTTLTPYRFFARIADAWLRGDPRVQHRRNHRWAREHPGRRDEAWFAREVVPKLGSFALNAIARATGLSLAACQRIRIGSQVPHQRHWDALLALVAE